MNQYGFLQRIIQTRIIQLLKFSCDHISEKHKYIKIET
jgi:hypothetical protein